MNYLEFKKTKEKPVGFVCNETISGWGLNEYPLNFLDNDDVVENFEDYSSFDDLLSVYEIDSFEDDFSDKFPDYEGVAILDMGTYLEGKEDPYIDSYTEFAIFVDTKSVNYRVLLLTAEYSDFVEIFPSFEEFYASLSKYKK
jgi:hypothetical protein